MLVYHRVRSNIQEDRLLKLLTILYSMQCHLIRSFHESAGPRSSDVKKEKEKKTS